MVGMVCEPSFGGGSPLRFSGGRSRDTSSAMEIEFFMVRGGVGECSLGGDLKPVGESMIPNRERNSVLVVATVRGPGHL
jgi:hypothetical protein